jgi:hypothetical protein
MPFVRCGVDRRVMTMTTSVGQCLNSIGYLKDRGSDLKDVTAHKAFTPLQNPLIEPPCIFPFFCCLW